MVGRHCPPNRHGLSTSYRKGEFALGGVDGWTCQRRNGGRAGGRREHRWPTPLSTPSRNTRRRETRGNGTNDRWDSAPLRARRRYTSPLSQLLTQEGENPLSDIDENAPRRLVHRTHVAFRKEF